MFLVRVCDSEILPLKSRVIVFAVRQRYSVVNQFLTQFSEIKCSKIFETSWLSEIRETLKYLFRTFF